MVDRSGQTFPPRMFNSVTWVSPEASATERSDRFPTASRTLIANFRATSPTGSSEGTSGHGDGASATGFARVVMLMHSGYVRGHRVMSSPVDRTTNWSLRLP